MAKPKRPTWFKVFDHQYPFITAMPDEAVGKAFRSAIAYFRDGSMPEAMDPLENALFQLLKANADEAMEDYERSVENGKKGSQKKKELQDGKTPSDPLREADADTDAEAETETEVRKEAEAIGRQKPPRPRFVPPTQEEVTAYCKKMDYRFDPECFMDYYISNGWRVGRNPMKDWKAAVRTWNAKEKEHGKNRNHKQPEIPTWTVGTTF